MTVVEAMDPVIQLGASPVEGLESLAEGVRARLVRVLDRVVRE